LVSKSVLLKVEVKGKGLNLVSWFWLYGEVWNETVAELSKITNVIFLLCWIWECPSIETPLVGYHQDQVISYVKQKKIRMLH
jgi:hypothetical protein